MSPPRKPVRLSRRTWVVFAVVLAATLAAELFVHPHGRFALDSLPAFGAWYGFGCCVALVLLAKLIMGRILQRSDDYYDG